MRVRICCAVAIRALILSFETCDKFFIFTTAHFPNMHNLSVLLRNFGPEASLLLQKTLLDRSGREWLTVLFGNVLRLTIGLASSVLIARSLGPESFGLYAVLTGIMAISATICDAGLTNSAVRFMAPAAIAQPAQVRQFAGAFLFAKISLAATGAALGFALSPHLATWILGNRDFAALTALSFVGVLTTAMSNAISTLLQAARQFRFFAVLQIFNPLLTLVATAALASLSAISVRTLLWVSVLGPVIVAIVGYTKAAIIFQDQRTERLITPSFSGVAIRRLFTFSKWVFLAAAGGALFSQIDLILARYWAGNIAAGHYALALGLAMKAAVLNGTLATALLPAAAAVSSAADRRNYLRSALAKTLAASVLLVAALPFIDLLIQFFYGEPFRPATRLTQILLLMVIVNLNVVPMTLLAYPSNHPQWLAMGEFGKMLLFLLGARLLVAGWSAAGIAAAKLTAEILTALFYLFLIRRLDRRF
jgi:O-antigen/teichoic acid export membrane protein